MNRTTLYVVLAVSALSALHAANAPVAAAAATKEQLHERCLAAIESNDVARASVKETLGVQMGEAGWMWQFTAADGGVYSCQVCDDGNPAAPCLSMGLRLAYRPKDGELQEMPAELDRKCVSAVQKEAKPRSDDRFIAHEIAARVSTTPAHTDKNWVYNVSLDGAAYRCVIRKLDGNFRSERQEGEEWRPF